MKKYKRKFDEKEIISYALYPDVFEDYLKYVDDFGDLSHMESSTFFYGLSEGEFCEVEVGRGRSLYVQLLDITKADSEGYRFLVFEVNGNKRDIRIKDKSLFAASGIQESSSVMADPDNDKEIGASIPGNIIKILVKTGDEIKKGQSLIVIEAMKMETNVTANVSGAVEGIFVKEGQRVKTGELLLKLK